MNFLTPIGVIGVVIWSIFVPVLIVHGAASIEIRIGLVPPPIVSRPPMPTPFAVLVAVCCVSWSGRKFVHVRREQTDLRETADRQHVLRQHGRRGRTAGDRRERAGAELAR